MAYLIWGKITKVLQTFYFKQQHYFLNWVTM